MSTQGGRYSDAVAVNPWTFAGVHGNVGTTVMAASAHGRDLGVYVGGPVDVLVCEPTATSVAKLQRILWEMHQTGLRPPMVLVNDRFGRGIPKPIQESLKMITPYVRGGQ